jgi:initiation factor 1A
MPKKKKGGGARRQIRNAAAARTRELVFAQETPEGKTAYGMVTAVLGDKRFSVRNVVGQVRVAKARGSMRRSERVGVGDLVLFSTRAFEEQTLAGHALLDASGKPRLGHADILCKYTSEEARKLQVYEEIPPGFYGAAAATGEHPSDEEDDVVFDDDAIDDI